MSKLQFRARALDASKPMPIYMSEELPDLTDYTAINRAVPQMPSGMEKEEECEHHLQRAICTGLIIPTPEVSSMADAELYERMYPANYKQPRQLIHMQPLAMEQDIPDYDMDSDDEVWVTEQAQRLEVSPLKFESMMDRLEKSSGQTVITLHEAKGLLNDDDDLIIAVYDYWLNKRLKTVRIQHPLILAVKTEHRLGSAANNPYIAFRRRTEKMQTRKNRKNDETSYEKMLKLRRDLSRALTLLELVKRREKAKREHLHLTIEIAEKRYQAQDFSGALVAEMSALKTNRPAFTPLYPNQFSNHNWVNKSIIKDEIVPRKEKRQYKKRKHKASHSNRNLLLGSGLEPLVSSDEEDAASAGTMLASPAEPESQDDEAPYVFRRNKNCSYHMPLKNGMGGWPWSPPSEDNGIADIRYRYTLTSISRPVPRCIGFARRRVGRGGRVILDRASTAYDDIWRNLDFTIVERPSIQERIVCENAFQIKSEEQKEMSRCNETASSELNNLFSEHNYNLTCRIRQECANEPIVKSEWTSGSNVVSNELVGKTEGVSDCSVINKSVVDANSDALLTTFKQDDFDDNRFITDFLKEVKTEWPHFRPKTPPEGEEVPCHLLPYTEESFQFNPSDLTPITVEIDNVSGSPPSMLLDTSTFTSEFTLNDLYLDLNLDNVQTCEDDLGLILNDTRQDLKNTSFRDSGGDSTNSIGKKYLSDQFGCSRVTVTEHGRTNNSECDVVGGARGALGGRAPDGGASKLSGRQAGCGTQMVLEHVGATRHTTSTAVRVFELVNHISRPTDTHLTNGPLAAVSLSESSLNRRGSNKQLLHNSTEDETPDGAMVGITLPTWSSSSSVYRLTNSSPQVRRISPAQTTHTLNSNSANNVDSMSPPLADSIDTTLVRAKSHHGHNNIDGNTANAQSKQAQGPGKQIVRKNNATTLAPMEVT